LSARRYEGSPTGRRWRAGFCFGNKPPGKNPNAVCESERFRTERRAILWAELGIARGFSFQSGRQAGRQAG